jgi:hypothetical protein
MAYTTQVLFFTQGEENNLYLRTSREHLSLTVPVRIQLPVPCSFVVEGSDLHSYVVSDDFTSFSLGKDLTIQNNLYEVDVPVHGDDDFPKPERGGFESIGIMKWKEVMTPVAPFAGDSIQWTTDCIWWEKGKVVITDLAVIAITDILEYTEPILLPAEAVKKVAKMLPKNAVVEIGVRKDKVLVSYKGYQFEIDRLDGKFPIPILERAFNIPEMSMGFCLERKELLTVLSTAGDIKEERVFTFDVGTGEITNGKITGTLTNHGTMPEELDLQVSLFVDRLVSILKTVVKSPLIMIKMPSEQGPLYIEHEDTTYIISCLGE